MDMSQAREALWEHPARASIFSALDEQLGDNWVLFANKILSRGFPLEVPNQYLELATWKAHYDSKHLFQPYLPDYTADEASKEDIRAMCIAAIEREARAIFVHEIDGRLIFESRLMHRNGWREFRT